MGGKTLTEEEAQKLLLRCPKGKAPGLPYEAGSGVRLTILGPLGGEDFILERLN